MINPNTITSTSKQLNPIIFNISPLIRISLFCLFITPLADKAYLLLG
jgi:hypothetical protein